ncbi:ABC transporter permease [Pelagibius sp.]|uniref:ABC transporter permease n=2 Tax=Pelagibius sp. TaxID=1931238 RepID=UPI003B50763A
MSNGKLATFLANPMGVLGLIVVVVFFAGAIFAPLLAPYDPNQINVQERLLGPSPEHLLGTDELGRDTFSRVLFGGRVALKIAAYGIFLSLTLGILLGMLAGYGPRWLDSALVMLFDTLRAFPSKILALTMVALTGPSLTMVTVIVVVLVTPSFARLTRTSTLALKNTEFIIAERSLGAGTARILWHHIMPNVVGPLLILAAMEVPVVITIEAGLSFLGLGVLPPTASWGATLREGYLLIRETPWLVIGGSVPLILTTLGFTFLGEALRDVFDPKLGKRR